MPADLSTLEGTVEIATNEVPSNYVFLDDNTIIDALPEWYRVFIEVAFVLGSILLIILAVLLIILAIMGIISLVEWIRESKYRVPRKEIKKVARNAVLEKQMKDIMDDKDDKP